MDKQARLCIALECMRVLGVIHNDGLQLAVSRQVGPQQKGETVLKCLEARGRLLLPRDVHAVRHFFPLQAHSINVKHLLGIAPLLLDDGPETIWVGSSGIFVSALSLYRALYIREPITGLKLIKPARVGNKLGYGARLLLLEVVEAIHGLLFGVTKGHIQALTLPMIHLRDQHLLHMDHNVGPARQHLGRTTTSRCFYS